VISLFPPASSLFPSVPLIKRDHTYRSIDLTPPLVPRRSCLLKKLTTHTFPTQSYRRFQVNFASVSDAAQFIDAIRLVCPCKENAGPPLPLPTSRMSTNNRRPAIPGPHPSSQHHPHPPARRHHTRGGTATAFDASSSSIRRGHRHHRDRKRAPQLPQQPAPPTAAKKALSETAGVTLPALSSSELSLAPLSSSDPAAPISGLATVLAACPHCPRCLLANSRRRRARSCGGLLSPVSACALCVHARAHAAIIAIARQGAEAVLGYLRKHRAIAA